MPDRQHIRSIGGFRIVRPLGNGGEREVYEAECTHAEGGIAEGERVALSCLKNGDRDRFLRETEILGALVHPNIIRLRHSFVHPAETGELYCVVTELLEGSTLVERIAAAPGGRGLPWMELWPILSQILLALREAAARGVTHGDLKPANIFICNNGTAKLLDFGLASRLQPGTATPGAAPLAGSLDYRAPEFVRRETQLLQADERSDVYSFGVLLHEAITGQLPLTPITGGLLDYAARWSSPQLPVPLLSDPVFRVWPGLRTCLSGCLQPDRSRRTASFSEVEKSLGSIHPIRVPPAEAPDVYEYTGVVGSGTFGDVLRARHSRDGKVLGEVAVKVLVQARYSHRLEREAGILRKLNHPHLIRYVDFRKVQTDSGPQCFLILEHLEGESAATLKSRLTRNPTGLDPLEMARLFAGYLDALGLLHANGIIHRDIRPQNLHAPEGRPADGKICDLGIALDQGGQYTAGLLPGCWDYLAPELGRTGSDPATPQCDIFSVGVTLFEAITGELPFPESRSLQDYAQRSMRPPPIAIDHPALKRHPGLVPILRTALAHDASARYSSAKGMRDALLEWIRNPQSISESAGGGAARGAGAAPPPLPPEAGTGKGSEQETKVWPLEESHQPVRTPAASAPPRAASPVKSATLGPNLVATAPRTGNRRSVLITVVLVVLALIAWGGVEWIRYRNEAQSVAKFRSALLGIPARITDPELNDILRRDSSPHEFLSQLKTWWLWDSVLAEVDPRLSNLLHQASSAQKRPVPWSLSVLNGPGLVWDRQNRKADLRVAATNSAAYWTELERELTRRTSAQRAQSDLDKLANRVEQSAFQDLPSTVEGLRTNGNRIVFGHMSDPERLRWDAQHNRMSMQHLFRNSP